MYFDEFYNFCLHLKKNFKYKNIFKLINFKLITEDKSVCVHMNVDNSMYITVENYPVTCFLSHCRSVLIFVRTS